jgi:hypothetical protein
MAIRDRGSTFSFHLIAAVIPEGSPDSTISGQKEGHRILGFATDYPTSR